MQDERELFISYCSQGNLEKIKEMVSNGLSLHSCGTYPLQFSAARGHLDVVKYLMENGVRHDSIALVYAAENGHLNIIKYLESCGVDIFNSHNLAFRCALCYGYKDVADYIEKRYKENGKRD